MKKLVSVLLAALLLIQGACVGFSHGNCAIHDLLADCVVVDLSSQLIFDTEEELLEYKKRMSAENAAQQSYF